MARDTRFGKGRYLVGKPRPPSPKFLDPTVVSAVEKLMARHQDLARQWQGTEGSLAEQQRIMDQARTVARSIGDLFKRNPKLDEHRWPELAKLQS